MYSMMLLSRGWVCFLASDKANEEREEREERDRQGALQHMNKRNSIRSGARGGGRPPGGVQRAASARRALDPARRGPQDCVWTAFYRETTRRGRRKQYSKQRDEHGLRREEEEEEEEEGVFKAKR